MPHARAVVAHRRERIVRAGALVALAACLSASDWWVSPAGSDADDGRSADHAFRTVQHGLDAAVAGDTVWLRGGTYREGVTSAKSATAAAPITLRAVAGETPTICGSQVVAGWTAAGGAIWKRAGWTINAQQAFDGGVALQQIGLPASWYVGSAADGSWMYEPVGAGIATMTAGSFWYDASTTTLYAWLRDGGDPNARPIEVSTRPRLLDLGNAANIHVVGVAFRHSATSAVAQMGGAVVLGTGCVLDACDVEECDFAGIELAYQKSGAQVLGCTASRNGDVGIQGARHVGFLIRGCRIAGNNTRGFNAQWHAGGIKLTTGSAGVVEANEVGANAGNGIWFDWCDSGAAIQTVRNRVHDNAAPGEGIIAEGSKNVLIADNLVIANQRRGVYVSASDQVRVLHNTIVGTSGFAAIDVCGMPRAGKTLTDVRVADNIVAGNTCGDDIRMTKENGADILRLSCDANLVWRAGGAVALWWGADSRGGWAGTRSTTVAGWAATTPFDAHGVQADPRFAVGAGDDWTLASGSPAIDAAEAADPIGNDYAGAPRPQGPRCDIGACERPFVDAAPSVTASAASSPVAGTAVALSAIATDAGGEATLIYHWSVVGTPPAPVTFSRNDANAAKATTATFKAVGAYAFAVSATDPSGRSALATVAVTVVASPTMLVVSPSSASTEALATKAFSCWTGDQFGHGMKPAAIRWVADAAAGTISSGGVLTAGAAAGGPWSVDAASGALRASARVTVVAPPTGNG